MASAPTKTHCPYCSLQCGITLDVSGGSVVLAPQDDFPTNRSGLCAKGWTAADLLEHPERLTGPLVRDERGSALRPATWNEALEKVVAAFQKTRQDHGRNAVGCFGGGGLTNEKAYQVGKFARVALRTSAIDYNGRFCMSPAAVASNRSFGIDRGLPFPLADIAQADVVLLVGGNPADTLPPAMQYFDEGRARGAKHIVVDPRRHRQSRRPSSPTRTGNRPCLGQRHAQRHCPRGACRSRICRRTDCGIRGRASRRAPVLAGSGGTDHRCARRRHHRRGAHAGWPTWEGRSGDDPDRSRRRAAQLGHRHGAGIHQSRTGTGIAGPSV